MADVEHLARRVDEHERRLGILEAGTKHVDDKFDALKELIDVKFENIAKSIEGWNKVGFWLLTTFGGVLITGIVGAAAWFIVNGAPK